ncbi:MAG: VWA domain-containing protein [Streptococcaceae bacterium]|jgi:uncharacterized protein YegL|nr:VWA domain-containing protein [Streptococcaceae bacterium]
MTNGLTELVFILDKSGSMSGLEKDTIGGYNAMLGKQEEVKGECRVTTVLFNNGYSLIHDRIDIKAIRPMTSKEYTVGGTTALLDAIGKTIYKIISAQRHTLKEYQAEKVIFVIITDGEENASHVYSDREIKKLIEQQKEKYGWEFVFLGANIDAIKTAGHFGISPESAVDYLADSEGTELNFDVMGQAVAYFRKVGKFESSFLEPIREDVKARGKKRATDLGCKS